MKKHWLISAAMLTLAANSAWAQDAAAPAAAPAVPAAASAPASPQTGSKHHTRTLEEARKYAHAKADKLDKMTEAEYAAQQEKRHAAHEKWKSMTPEERAAAKKARHDKWLAKKQGAASTSTPATAPASAPAAAPASAQ